MLPFAVVVEGEDMINLKQVLWNQTLNREKSELGEYDNSLSTDDDNYEYVPTK